ncbi:MAG: glycosyltransferase family 2 protein [Methanobrevibacter sp.]|nr:glycosyltransferase family 2 protein [Methanobrevibacter sp.]
MRKISVIIPVFNTAKYLSNCLDSVLTQSLKDIEVICINDGSTDNSLEILNDYASRDSRITVINQKNSGLSASRNRGVKHSSSEYILFLDSDDYIKKDCLEKLYEISKSKSLDVLMFKLINFDDKTNEKSTYNYFDMPFLKNMVGENVFNWMDVENRLFDISVTAPGKLFKMDLIKDIDFPEGLIFEDNLFFTKVALKADRMYFLDEYIYFRRIRNDSITNSYFKDFSDVITIYELMEEFLIKENKFQKLYAKLYTRKYRDVYNRFNLTSDEYKKDFFEKLKTSFKKDSKNITDKNALSKRSLEIFNSAIESDTYVEFQLKVQLFDLNQKYNKLSSKNSKCQKELNELKKSRNWKLTKIFRKN